MAVTYENPLDATPETLRVVAANYACMGITIIFLLTRTTLHRKWGRKLGLDDLFLLLALISDLIESVTIEHAVRRGLGTYIRPGNSFLLNRLSQLIYASDLLFIASLLFAKLSIIQMLFRFAPKMTAQKAKIMILQLTAGAWFIFSILAIGLQCGTPMPWIYLPGRCAGGGSFWYPVLITSIIIDLWVSFCAWYVAPDLRIRPTQRQIIAILFSLKIFQCIFAIAQLALIVPALNSNNQPRAMPNPTVMKTLVMNASIIAASLPSLYKPLAMYQPDTPQRNSMFLPNELHDIKVPGAVPRPRPQKPAVTVDDLDLEGDLLAPPVVNDSFTNRLSIAFNKEVKVAHKTDGTYAVEGNFVPHLGLRDSVRQSFRASTIFGHGRTGSFGFPRPGTGYGGRASTFYGRPSTSHTRGASKGSPLAGESSLSPPKMPSHGKSESVSSSYSQASAYVPSRLGPGRVHGGHENSDKFQFSFTEKEIK